MGGSGAARADEAARGYADALARRMPRGWRRRIACAPRASAFWWRMLPEPLFAAPRVVRARGARRHAAVARASRPTGNGGFPPRSTVPAKFRRALLAFEDKRFEQHRGVDPLAIARAVRLNARAGRVVSGGSTLTMQLARLSRGDGGDDATLRAQGRRSAAGAALECAFGKDEICSRCTRRNAPFGGNVVGLEAAAWRYFGRDPADAVLGGGGDARGAAQQSRRWCTSTRNRERLQAQARLAVAAGCIAAGELSRARSRPRADRAARGRAARAARLRAAPAGDAARAVPGPAPPASPRSMRGCRRSATRAVSEHVAMLARQQVHNAAALIIDNQTFEVLAYVGNGAHVAISGNGD